MENFMSVGSAASGINKTFLATHTQLATCEKHGEFDQEVYASGRKRICPECIREERATEDAKKLDERKIKHKNMIEARIGKAGIPVRYQGKTISTYQVAGDSQQDIVGKVKNYALEFNAKHSGRNMAFLGNAGTGKTHLACSIASHIIKNLNGSARFTTVSELARIVRESKSFDSEVNESQVISDFLSYDLLIVDEVGVQSGSDAESRALFDVFNTRYENMRPTIFISNLEFSAFKGALGERIIDRLREGGGEILMFNWGTHRK